MYGLVPMQLNRNHYTKAAPTSSRAARIAPKLGEKVLPEAPAFTVAVVEDRVEVAPELDVVVLGMFPVLGGAVVALPSPVVAIPSPAEVLPASVVALPSLVDVLPALVVALLTPVVAGELPDTASTSGSEPELRQYW